MKKVSRNKMSVTIRCCSVPSKSFTARGLQRDVVHLGKILGWPIAPLYMSPNAGGGGCGVSANDYSCALGAQINFGDLTPYLTYVIAIGSETATYPCAYTNPLQLKRRCASYRTSQWPTLSGHNLIIRIKQSDRLDKKWTFPAIYYLQFFFVLLCLDY